MKPLDLIESAETLLKQHTGKASSVSLRRATSSAYYAVFHCLARSSADLLIGGAGSARSKPAWKQVYRGLQHTTVQKACDNAAFLSKFPPAIVDFGNAFVSLQAKRHKADYDPYAKFTKSEVRSDIDLAKQVITDYAAVEIKHRRAFCAYVLLGKPRN